MIQLVELTYSLKEARNKNQKEMHQDYAKFLVWYYFKHSADFVSTYNILCPWLYALEVEHRIECTTYTQNLQSLVSFVANFYQESWQTIQHMIGKLNIK